MLPITIACEGPTDAAVLRRLLAWVGLEAVPQAYIQQGKGRLDKKLRAYNEAARYAPWLVVRDLDSDTRCAPEVARSLLPAPAAGMCFRLAIRQIEAWLMADRAGMARFLEISADLMPVSPDDLEDAKVELIGLASRSRRRSLREDLVPGTGFSRTVGPGYTARLIEFTSNIWDPRNAAAQSPSLASCIAALKKSAR